MNRRTKFTFLALVLAQAAHSIEEYTFRLYDVFAPARFVSGLISNDRRIGFITFNIALFGFGLWCYLFPVRRGAPSAVSLIWVWIVIEFVNGVGHPLWSIVQQSYTPGVATAPVLLLLSLYLGWQVSHDSLHHERNT
jgi:Protein of unknown function with HXXEE motif